MTEDNNKSKMKSLGWELAQKIFKSPKDGGMTSVDLADCFGTSVVDEVMCMDYADAAEKYRAWKTQKEAFHVGDEVKYPWRASDLYVVTNVNDETVFAMDAIGASFCIDKRSLRKTGRTYPQIRRVLDGLKEGSTERG